MSEHEIRVKNLGPIQQLTVKLERYGVTVLSAPNGAGKSIFIDAMAKVAAGEGGVPLRSGTDRGSIDGLGIHVTLTPKSTRSTGEFLVANLEGKLNLANLVEPGVKDPVAADKRRIKALIALTGVDADRHLFIGRPEFPEDEFYRIVQTETLQCKDLVEMAERVARDYHAEARNWERLADEDAARAQACREMCAAVDPSAESDPEVLQEAYFAAQQGYSMAAQREKMRETAAAEAARAAAELTDLNAQDTPDVASAELAVREKNKELVTLQQMQAALQEQLDATTEAIRLNVEEFKTAQSRAKVAELAAAARVKCEQVMAKFAAMPALSPEEFLGLKTRFEETKHAMEEGVRIRDAKLQQTQVAMFEKSSVARRARADLNRQAAATADLVLSESLQTSAVKIMAVGGHQRVMAWDEQRQEFVPYHELSATEKWKLAIEVGVDRVGEEGLLLIKQEAWEGVDCWNRDFIDRYSSEKHVYILTGEATRDPDDGRDFCVKHLEA